MILRACTVCGAISDKSRCPRHRYRDKRPSAAKRGYDGRWQRTRALFLSGHSQCQYPGCRELATEAHHRDGLGPKGPHGHDPTNLQALCSYHHKTITAEMQPGG
jgi:5-methylcytosine-specific restriction protein A